MKTITLSNGVQMPLLGYGVFQIDPQETQKCVSDALEVGYRMIDTAQAYRNEAGVGAAVAQSGLKREDVFIVSKVLLGNYGEQSALDSINRSLERLQTSYIDLMLLHQPYSDVYGSWRALERAYADKKVRAIGVSNFYADHLTDIMMNTKTNPMVNQVETHIFSPRHELRAVMKRYNCAHMSWGCLAQGQNGFFDNEILKSIGAKYGKTSAQVGLRYLLEDEVICIPKSVRKERMAENFAVFDFELSSDDRAQIAQLDTGRLLLANHHTAEFTEHMINLRGKTTF